MIARTRAWHPDCAADIRAAVEANALGFEPAKADGFSADVPGCDRATREPSAKRGHGFLISK